MRPIKFRGKAFDGELVFGNYFFDSGNDKTYIGEIDSFDEVKPESVVQLVGYDADGNEIYEGDQLIRLDGVIGFLVPDVVTDYPDYKLAQ